MPRDSGHSVRSSQLLYIDRVNGRLGLMVETHVAVIDRCNSQATSAASQ